MDADAFDGDLPEVLSINSSNDAILKSSLLRLRRVFFLFFFIFKFNIIFFS